MEELGVVVSDDMPMSSMILRMPIAFAHVKRGSGFKHYSQAFI